MNTIRSTWIGWGTLCVAGGGAYYFAKKSIDADKKARFENQQQRRQMQLQLEAQAISQPTPKKRGPLKKGDPVGDPSSETPDVAPSSVSERKRERSKYEPTEPYRTKKGDRFS